MEDFSLGLTLIGKLDVYKFRGSRHGYLGKELVKIFAEGLSVKIEVVVFSLIHKIKILSPLFHLQKSEINEKHKKQKHF